MPNLLVNKSAVMGEMEFVLKRLSHQGLIEFLTKSCQVQYVPTLQAKSRQELIDMILVTVYGKEAFEHYRNGGSNEQLAPTSQA